MHLADNINIPSGLIGGLIIGSSASTFLYVTGQLTGLSGITEGLMKGEDWNWSYMVGLCSSGFFLSLAKPDAFGNFPSRLSSLTLVAAGILTGFGTRLSGGCTSGHGLCGLARRSPRSLTAVLTFMATGGATAFITRHQAVSEFLQTSKDPVLENMFDYSLEILVPTLIAIGTGLLITKNRPLIKDLWSVKGSSKEETNVESSQAENKSSRSSMKMHIVSLCSGFLFGTGLAISGMCSPERVLRFLDFSGSEGWDPTLMAVLGGGVAVTFTNFHVFHFNDTNVLLECAPGDEKCLSKKLNMGIVDSNMKIDWKLLLGAALFGVGWGTAGMCPGPAIVSLGATVSAAGKFVPGMILGMILKEVVVG